MKKDILILCQYFYPEYVSSATLPTNLAEELTKKGKQIDVFCGDAKEYYTGVIKEQKENYKGININRIKYSNLDNKKNMGRLINFLTLFLGMLFRIPKMKNYEMIIVYSNPPILPFIAYISSLIYKNKTIFVAFDIYPDSAILIGAISKKSIISKSMNWMNNKIYSKIDKVIVLGLEMKEYLIRHKKLESTKIEIIPNWYDERNMSEKIFNNKFKKLREDYKLIVSYTGNMGMLQDMDTIIDGINLLDNKEICFILTGHGKKKNEVDKRLSEKNRDNIKVYNFLEGTDYEDVLNITDIGLVTLEKGAEGIAVPSKTYGYLAAGKPILSIMSRDTDIARELEEYNAGDTIDQGDIVTFKEKINNYLKEDLLYIRSKNARKLFEEKYTKQICTGKYLKVIEMLKNGDEIDV